MGEATNVAAADGLHIAPGVTLPIDYVTQTAAILAQRRKGKTYTAAVIAEELAGARLPWVALDPTGAWWGLRSSADGLHAGLPVVVLGGQHGDLPLDRYAGAAIADLVLDHPGWYVLDLSLLEGRPAEREFATAFGQRLHRRKMQPGMDFPLHLFIDEADMFVPQEKETKADVALLAAYQGIVRRGGLHGLGCTLISQRPALVNKNVLTQLDILILLRLVAGNDQDAVSKNYVSRFLDKIRAAEVMDSLATLPVGTAWFLEPGADPPLAVRQPVRARRTFNSSATPKAGEQRVEPQVFAEVDLDAIALQMAEAVERVLEDDPAHLRRQIGVERSRRATLERDLSELAAEVLALTEEASRPTISDEQIEAVREIVEALGEHVENLKPTVDAALAGARELLAPLEVAYVPASVPVEPKEVPAPAAVAALVERSAAGIIADQEARRREPTNGDAKLKAGARRMVVALARLHPTPLTRVQLGTLADISPNSGTFSDYKSALVRAGLIADDGGRILLTAAGAKYAGPDLGVGAPSPRELKEMWSGKFKAGARRMLDELFDVHPRGLTRDELGERAEIARNSGTFSDYLSALRRNYVIEERDGQIYAGAALFIGADRG